MDRYRDQIVTCDVDVSLHSKTLFIYNYYNNGTRTHCCVQLPVSKLVSCAFSPIPIMSLFIYLSPLFFKATCTDVLVIQRSCPASGESHRPDFLGESLARETSLGQEALRRVRAQEPHKEIAWLREAKLLYRSRCGKDAYEIRLRLYIQLFYHRYLTSGGRYLWFYKHIIVTYR